ncbi:chondroadherin-like [Dromaius novaehollandiae]|uniref:chondroadherin-like n=1 Tax=Dromaius novaehollandiae TaxID=8790 RepID=UPI00311DCC06
MAAKGTVLTLWPAVLALPLLRASPAPSVAASCPSNCSCAISQQLVSCANASLAWLPAGLPRAAVELDLQHNLFPTLEAGFFPDLPALTTLFLGSSGVERLEAGAFGGLGSLYHLHLDHNLLRAVPAGAFANLSSLVFLHLEHNRITHLPPGVFSSLKHLLVLDLSHNELQELSDQALGGLPQLRRLQLSANRLANLSGQVLPRGLRALWLDSNRLASVPRALRGAPLLATLHLSGNPIRQLTALSFGRGPRALGELFLDGLALEKVTATAFSRLRRLEVLSLRDNGLETLPSLASLRALSGLYLTGNKWRCDCDLLWLWTWQRKRPQAERGPIACSSPRVLQGRLLADVELQKLTCPPFGTSSTVTSPMEGGRPMATLMARDEPLPSTVTATAATITALATVKTTMLSTARPPTTLQGHTPESPDPCLANSVSGLRLSAGSDTSLAVAWAFLGEHEEFEVRYQAPGAPEQALRVMGGPPELQLHGLRPGTEYRVCVIPWSGGLGACLSLAPQQCAVGHTAGTARPLGAWPAPSPWAAGIGTTAALLILVGLAMGAMLRLRRRPVPFQRYYNDDEPPLGHRGADRAAACGEDDDCHGYVLAASQQPKKPADCAHSPPLRSPATPTYVPL